MPNHCYQQVRIEGVHKLVRLLWNGLTENGFENGCAKNPQFNQLIIPMPFELWDGAECDWYDWRNENWNTKWDVCQVEIVEEITRENYAEFSFDAYTKYWFTFKCWTAWAPPVPVWQTLYKMGIEVNASYEDEGGGFEGTFIEGKNKSWRPYLKEVVSNG
jgi:hypothetical protein